MAYSQLVNSRNERRNYKQRVEMFRKQLASNPAMRSNAEMQIQMMRQQKDFSRDNFERDTDSIISQIEAIERLLDQQKVRTAGSSLPPQSSKDSATLKASIDRLSLQWGELRSEVNIFKSEFARQLDQLRQVVATLQK
ncbi:hypothetical protein DYB37_001888 [Aphanomyces astaci]|uniref:Uncharacterized protein n=1 Tax=Aphanomyces astaci TaxID=112090 RepID=A0A3R7AQX3_APHAT|nr:hypothetical protein AaE_013507 [Aphanomyces astaci]RHY90968.1 hypothetical protein DYB35_001049 [Aphanomyces astaci]RHZ14345.1 hypothetical protein DYB37_001888 [Aphanomyces astaci]